MKKFVIVLLLTVAAVTFASAEQSAPVVGSIAPQLSLLNLEGKNISLQDYLNKKPVILVFFTSWSKSCQAELSDLKQIDPSRAQIIAVSFDKKIKELTSFISRSEIGFPVLSDKKLSSIDKFQILIIPSTFCINREGVIEKMFVDYDDNVNKAIKEWL